MHHFTAERLHDARHLRLPSLSSSFASLAVKEPVLRIVCKVKSFCQCELKDQSLFQRCRPVQNMNIGLDCGLLIVLNCTFVIVELPAVGLLYFHMSTFCVIFFEK